jgi:hypothetical protein
MAQDNNPVYRDELAALLRAKDRAQEAFSEAGRIARVAAESPAFTIEERVTLDLKYREALNASCAADNAYNDALDRFSKQDAA